MPYNRKQIELNRDLIKRSVEECLAKLLFIENTATKKLLECRIETTFILVSLALSSLKKLPADYYLMEVISEMGRYKAEWSKYKSNIMMPV